MFANFVNMTWVIMQDAEIIRQLDRRFLWTNIEKAAGEADHITIRLASKAMEAVFIQLHAWILIIMKRALAHAAVIDVHAVSFSGLTHRHTFFDGFNIVMSIPRIKKAPLRDAECIAE